jgi:toxin ParE1/3/4
VRLRWSNDALEDLVAIRRYIAEDHPAAAQSVAQRILRTIAYLRDHPGIGRAGRIQGTRELIIPGLPYIVPYRMKENLIELLRVLHTSRQWPKEEK